MLLLNTSKFNTKHVIGWRINQCIICNRTKVNFPLPKCLYLIHLPWILYLVGYMSKLG